LADKISVMQSEVKTLAQCLAAIPGLESVALGDEFYYASLPLCILDAVFSIGIRYEMVQAVVDRYCKYAHQPMIRINRAAFPPRDEQLTVSNFIDDLDEIGVETFSSDVIANRCRTSPRGGVLKTEACLKFATVLRHHGVEVLQDVASHRTDVAMEEELRKIPGQGSGVSTGYFFMLAGSDDLVKPDRMVVGFLEECLGRTVPTAQVQELMTLACRDLQADRPELTPRLLDYAVWGHQRRRLRQVGGSRG
jgi:hypothetical protein